MIEEKKCSECFADIPKKAKKCSHCGSKQKGQYGWGHAIIIIIAIFVFIGVFSGNDKPTPSTTNYSEGYKLAFIDSKDAQYARANEPNYNRLINSIEQNCTLDSGQKISDMLVVTQRLIKEGTGIEFKLGDIATYTEEVLIQSKEKVDCAIFFASIATIAGSAL